MNTWFLIALIAFIVLSAVMTLIILVQRPQGGGLAGAFGGASGAGTDTVFGGRVGDALTTITVVMFVAFLGLAISLSLIDSNLPPATTATTATTADSATTTPADGSNLPEVNVTTTPIQPVSDDPGGPMPFEEVDPSTINPAILKDHEGRAGQGSRTGGGQANPPDDAGDASPD
jgi:protein translocase SecG subunit